MASMYAKASMLFTSANKKVHDFWESKGLLVSLIVVPLVMIWLVLILMGPWLNTLDRQEWKCEVVSADPVIRGGGLRGGSSNAFIVVQTKNCGEILVDGSTVSFDNQEAVAATFEPGSEWIFEVGWFARNYSMKIERVSPTVEFYHRVS